MRRATIFLFFAFLLVLLFGADYLQGQDSASVFRSNLVRQNNFTIGTQQELIVMKNWRGTNYLIRHFQEALYNQSLESNKLVQGNAATQIWIRRRQLKKVQPLIFWESDAFLNSKNGRSQWYTGLSLLPFRGMEITPLIGYSLDMRNGRVDHGVTYAGLFSWLPSFQSQNTRMNLRGFSRVKYINPRRQDNHRVEWDLSTILPGGVKPWVLFLGSFHELDDYQGKSVQRMLSDTLDLQAGIHYRIPNNWFTEASQRVSRQHRRFNYKSIIDSLPEFNPSGFQQDEIQSLVRVSFAGKSVSFFTLYEFILIDRIYELENRMDLPTSIFEENLEREQQKNYRSAFQKWSLFSRLKLNARHALEAEYSSQYLKYDTPLNSNLDDRDEITYIVRTAWEAKWRKNFNMNYELTGQSRYSGFLAGVRSRDNYLQYNLKNRLVSEWTFFPGYTIKAAHAVYVTYNVKSFGDPQFTDRSTRFWENQYDLSAAWNRNWKSVLSVERKVQQLSYLNWSDFAETPLDTTWFTTFQQTNEYTWGGKSLMKTWTVAFGFKYFQLQRNLPARISGVGSVNQPILLRMINRQSGPITEGRLRTHKNNFLSCRIWWQRQVVLNQSQTRREDGYSGITLSLDEVQTRQTIFRPYFEISLSLGF